MKLTLITLLVGALAGYNGLVSKSELVERLRTNPDGNIRLDAEEIDYIKGLGIPIEIGKDGEIRMNNVNKEENMPEAPKAVPEALKAVPEAPKAVPEAPKAVPEAPKAVPESQPLAEAKPEPTTPNQVESVEKTEGHIKEVKKDNETIKAPEVPVKENSPANASPPKVEPKVDPIKEAEAKDKSPGVLAKENSPAITPPPKTEPKVESIKEVEAKYKAPEMPTKENSPAIAPPPKEESKVEPIKEVETKDKVNEKNLPISSSNAISSSQPSNIQIPIPDSQFTPTKEIQPILTDSEKKSEIPASTLIDEPQIKPISQPIPQLPTNPESNQIEGKQTETSQIISKETTPNQPALPPANVEIPIPAPKSPTDIQPKLANTPHDIYMRPDQTESPTTNTDSPSLNLNPTPSNQPIGSGESCYVGGMSDKPCVGICPRCWIDHPNPSNIKKACYDFDPKTHQCPFPNMEDLKTDSPPKKHSYFNSKPCNVGGNTKIQCWLSGNKRCPPCWVINYVTQQLDCYEFKDESAKSCDKWEGMTNLLELDNY